MLGKKQYPKQFMAQKKFLIFFLDQTPELFPVASNDLNFQRIHRQPLLDITG